MKKRLLLVFEKVLGWCCRRYVDRVKPYIIGVTGSVGKTSCRLIVSQVLQQSLKDVRVVTSPQNFNGELGLFLSVLEIEKFSPSVGSFTVALWKGMSAAFFWEKQGDMYVLEYGIDRPGEMALMTGFVKPHVAIVTCIDYVHQQAFADIDAIALEKSGLVVSASDLVLLYAGDKRVMAMRDVTNVDVLSYGYKRAESLQSTPLKTGQAVDSNMTEMDVVVGDLKVSDDLHASFDLVLGQKKVTLQMNRWSWHDAVYVGLGRVLVDILCEQQGWIFIGTDTFALSVLPGRASLLSGKRGSIIFDSSYNASPASMQALLRESYEMWEQFYSGYRFVPVIGDMRELGDVSREQHVLLAQLLLELNPFCLYLVGQEVLTIKSWLEKHGYKGEIVHGVHSRELGKKLSDDMMTCHRPSFVFVKGSQNTIFLEELVKEILAEQGDVKLLCRQSEWWMGKKRN